MAINWPLVLGGGHLRLRAGQACESHGSQVLNTEDKSTALTARNKENKNAKFPRSGPSSHQPYIYSRHTQFQTYSSCLQDDLAKN
jgi:hypothetical protein